MGKRLRADAAARTAASRTPAPGDAVIPEGVCHGARADPVTGHAAKVYVTFQTDGRVLAGYRERGVSSDLARSVHIGRERRLPPPPHLP